MKIPKVVIPLATGFEEIIAITLIDVLRRGGVEVIVASLDPELMVKGAHSITLKCDRTLDKLYVDSIDMLLIPLGTDAYYFLKNHKPLQNMLRTVHTQNSYLQYTPKLNMKIEDKLADTGNILCFALTILKELMGKSAYKNTKAELCATQCEGL